MCGPGLYILCPWGCAVQHIINLYRAGHQPSEQFLYCWIKDLCIRGINCLLNVYGWSNAGDTCSVYDIFAGAVFNILVLLILGLIREEFVVVLDGYRKEISIKLLLDLFNLFLIEGFVA